MWPSEANSLIAHQQQLFTAEPERVDRPPHTTAGIGAGVLSARHYRSIEQQMINGNARSVCDHPRRAGLALHLAGEMGFPTIGVTHRHRTQAASAPASGTLGVFQLLAAAVGITVIAVGGAVPGSRLRAWTLLPPRIGAAIATISPRLSISTWREH